jgi:hypothetical protein
MNKPKKNGTESGRMIGSRPRGPFTRVIRQSYVLSTQVTAFGRPHTHKERKPMIFYSFQAPLSVFRMAFPQSVRIMDVRKADRVWTDLRVQNTYVVAVASMPHRVAEVASGDRRHLDSVTPVGIG